MFWVRGTPAAVVVGRVIFRGVVSQRLNKFFLMSLHSTARVDNLLLCGTGADQAVPTGAIRDILKYFPTADFDPSYVTHVNECNPELKAVYCCHTIATTLINHYNLCALSPCSFIHRPKWFSLLNCLVCASTL